MAQNDPTGEPMMTENRLRNLEERLHELEHQNRRPRAMLERMLPPEARQHLRAAQRERLLAVRALIDAAIKRAEEAPDERPRRPESVRID